MNIDILTLLNETTLRCLKETNEKKIIGAFSELAVNVLGASFCFVWMKKDDQKFDLAYRSRRLPYTPISPRVDGRNVKVLKQFKPDFISRVEKRKDEYDVSRYMKSFAVIPIVYRKNIYGNIVICFKKPERFHKEKRILCVLIGSNTAQVLTILRNKEALRESEEYRRTLKEEEARARFLSDAMHEIRTPFAVIKGNVDLALAHGQTVSQLTALKAIDEEVRHLMRIFSELELPISNDFRAQGKRKTGKIKLAPFFQHQIQRWKILAKSKSIVIRVQNIPDVSLYADESYLNKLFTNIVQNAITYGKRGGHISISGIRQDDMVRIDIRDDGIGISEDNLKHIFERFYRVDKSRPNLKFGSGAGLGLAITRWIAEVYGGEVTAKSVFGKGSTFSVSLPCIYQ